MQPMQAFRCRSSGKLANIPTSVDPKTGKYIVLWKDIQRAFKNADSIWKGNDMLLFLRDENLEEITPLRIAHYPDDVLEVDVGETGYMSPSSKDSVITPLRTVYHPGDALEMDNENPDRVHHGGELSTPTIRGTFPVDETFVINQSLVGCSTHTIKETQSIVLAQNQPSNAALQTLMSGQANIMIGQAAIVQSMNQNFDRLQVEMDKNKELQGQLLQMQEQMDEKQQKMQELQQKMDEKQQQVYQLQQETKEELLKKQQEILEMQQRALDRLAIIQNSVRTLATQNYELHEYPIPRLFIVLPKTLGVSDRIKGIFSDQFRLYFLCECGTHTMTEDSTTPHQIHLAKHEGYDLERPTAFFERYGGYVLALLHMIKYGITVAGLILPPLASSKIVDGIDTAQRHLDYLKKNITPLVDSTINFLNDTKSGYDTSTDLSFDHSELDQLEALEGADLRQLESYLKVKDQGRILGNLYRIVTSEGHVKWVCFDHYQTTYREELIKQLREIVSINRGTYVEKTGSIKIDLATIIQARQFYNAMVKARFIHELEITFGWDATMDELREFARAVTKTNVINLTVNGTHLKRPARDVVNRTRRFDPIMMLASNNRIQLLHLKGFDRFFVRVSKSALVSSPNLRVLSMQSELPLEGRFRSIDNFVKFYSGLTTFEVQLPQDVLITKTVSDILSRLPRLELLSIDQWTRSFTATIVKGKIQRVVFQARRLDNFTADDLKFTLKENIGKLAIWFYPDHRNEIQLSNILHTSEFISLQLRTKDNASYLEVAATPDWKLQDLVEVAASKFCDNHGSLRIVCTRLTLIMEFIRDRTQITDVKIMELDGIRYDDIEFMERGHLTLLEIRGSPRKDNSDRLAQIFRHCSALIRVQIEYKEGRPADRSELDMTLWNLAILAATNTLCEFKSLTVSNRRLSITAGISQERIKDIVVAIDRLDLLDSEDLKYIQGGCFSKMAIRYTQSVEDRLPEVLHALELSHIRIAVNGIQRLGVIATLEWKLHDLLRMATSEAPEGLKSLSLDCARLSLTGGIWQGEITNIAMTVERIDRLDSDDLTYIRRGQLTQLTVTLHASNEEEEKDWLADVLRHNQALEHLGIKYQEERDSAIGNVTEKFLNLVKVTTSNTSNKLETIAAVYDQVSLALRLAHGKVQNTVMSIKQLSDLHPDDLAIMELGSQTRLDIHDTPLKADKARLARILQVNVAHFHLQIGHKGEHLPVITEHDVNFWDIVKMTALSTLCKIESLRLDYWKLSVTIGVNQVNIHGAALTVDHFNDLISSGLDTIQRDTLAKLSIKYTSQLWRLDRLDTIITARFSCIQIRHQGMQCLDILVASERNLQDLMEIVISESNGASSISIDSRRYLLTANVIHDKIQDAVLTTTRLSDLHPDDLAIMELGSLTRLEMHDTPLKADKARLARILQDNEAHFHLQIGHKGGRQPTSTGLEMKLWDVLDIATSRTFCNVESLKIDYWNISAIAESYQSKVESVVLSIDQLDHLIPKELDGITWDTFAKLAIKYTPRRRDEEFLNSLVAAGFSYIQTKYQDGPRLAILVVSEWRLQDLVYTAVSESSKELESFSIICKRLSMTASNKSQDAVMTIKQLSDLHPDDLAVIELGYLARLEISDSPLRIDEARLAQILQGNMAHFHIRIGRKGEWPPINTELDMDLWDIVKSVTSGTCRRIESLTIDYGTICIVVGFSLGVTQSVDVTTTTLGDLSTNCFAFIQQGHFARLTLMQTFQEADKGRLFDILRNSPSPSHLQLACSVEHSLSVVDLVISTRDRVLQDQGSCNLRLFELMDKELVPFDVLADCDDDHHIQSQISFHEDSRRFEMRTWIRFKKEMVASDEYRLRDFVKQYGWSTVFIDGGVAHNNALSILEEIPNMSSSQLESLWISCDSVGMKLDALDKIITQSPKFKDLGLYLNPDNGNQWKIAQPLLGRQGAILTKFRIYGRPSERWSWIVSSFPNRKCFPALVSFEFCPDSDDKIPSNCVEWLIAMVSDSLRGLITHAYFHTVPRAIYKLILDEMDSRRRSGLSTSLWAPLKNIALRNTTLLSEEWERLIRVINMSTLEHLDLQSSNFSEMQFWFLVNHISSYDKSDVPLRTLNVAGTDLDSSSSSFNEMAVELREKAPLAKLIMV